MMYLPPQNLRIVAQDQDLRGRDSSGAQCIVPRVYLTGYSTATNDKDLSHLAATHIVSILDGDVDLPAFIKEENKLHIDIEDTMQSNLLQHLDKTTAFIQAALEENKTNVVVVGQSRQDQWF